MLFFSAIVVYGIFTVIYSSHCGFIWNQHSNDQLPVGLLAQLVEHCNGIAQVMGSNTVQRAWIFFRPYFLYCSSSVHYSEDRFHIHVFIRSSNLWISYIYSHLFITSRVYLEPTLNVPSSRLLAQSFIHLFTGLYRINIISNSQLAGQLSW